MSDLNPRKLVDDLRARLKGNGDEPCQVPLEADRRHLLKMSDKMRLMQSEIGDHRQLKLLRHVRRMAIVPEWPSVADFEENDEADEAGVDDIDDIEKLLNEKGYLGLTLEYRAAADALVRWIHSEYENEHTNQDYRTALRSFGRYRLKKDEPPESLAWIPTTTSNDFNPVPSERDLLRWEEDVVPMLEACHNPRDRALIAVQFEAGCRSGELFDIRVGDVFDGEYTTSLHVDGKRGERSVALVISLPYLQDWLTDDRSPDRDDAYLWSKLNSDERPSYRTWRDYFEDAAERADVTKSVTPTNFRKSNTRWLVLQGYSQARIEDRQGRKRGSDHTRRYMARFGEESQERSYARLHGLEVEPEEDAGDISPVQCPRCQRETPRDNEHCMWCNFALSEDAVDAAKTRQELGLQAVGRLVSEEGLTPEEAAAAIDRTVDERVQAALADHDGSS
ncbi:site-specific integrase [Halanaeroarchaeum sulfurireducens]|uniref:Integrase family protein n=1 Tax=Halanaeroarchaeum sulfurireducens TaxID=1604004 RepID=A0A0N9MLK4_9EURY|nr:site-specific integrase [Halanaeroarchaeum sulfurireducens]ALG82876.1 integrase family protein [Halanaeroarchaeum sulfurireducens]